ncbi:MAG: dienelactone hydrolase family protein [Pseudomonadota bacterium]
MQAAPWLYRDGELEFQGELYRPTTLPNGGSVLVVHEADGIGGNVRRHCERLAGLGYLAAAADIHGGGRVLEGEEMQRAIQHFQNNPMLLRRRVGVAVEALCKLEGVAADCIAAIGFCFGGMAVLELARSGARLNAVASFHGILATQAPAARDAIRARVLAATGARDPLVPAEQVATFQHEMSAAGADWHLLVHGQALHSYTNRDVAKLGDARMAYDPDAHHLSWTMLVNFLAVSLQRQST